jgi:hypothetical protein
MNLFPVDVGRRRRKKGRKENSENVSITSYPKYGVPGKFLAPFSGPSGRQNIISSPPFTNHVVAETFFIVSFHYSHCHSYIPYHSALSFIQSRSLL